MQRAYSIPHFCKVYGIGRSKAYEEIKAQRLKSVKVGRRRLITHDGAECWLAAMVERAEQ